MRIGKVIFIISILMSCSLLFVSASTLMAATVTLTTNAVVRGGVVRANWSGFTGNVNVAVYKGSSFWVYAVTNVAGTGYQDLDTTGWELRSDYRVKVELRSNTSVYQYSSYFSVSDPSVWLSTTSVTQGETVRANWSNFSGNVNVAVYKGGSFWVYAVTNVAGTGYHDLNTTGWELRSDYRIKIGLRSNTSIYKYSNYFSVTEPARPDLVVQSQNVNPSILEAGFSTFVSCTVRNQGNNSASSSTLKYYLSSNTTYDSGDTYLGDDYVGSLSPAETSAESATLTIPSGTSTGTWYILFLADANTQVSESNENNNVGYKQISVSKPNVSLSTTSVVQGETVRVNWSGFDGNINVAVYKGSGFWVHSLINVAGTGYQDLVTTGWEAQSNYCVKIELRANTDVHEYSDYFAVNIPVPTGVTAVYQSSYNWNYITWNIVSGATGYKVYWGTTPGVTTSSNVMPETSSTEYGHTNVEAGYCYYYRVTAVNSGGESALSSEVLACVLPATPTGLSLVQITGGFRISWNNVSGTSGTNPYKIYWGTNDSVDETNYSGIIEDNGTPSDHINLESGTTYYYRIKACNSSGCSALSGIVSALYQPSPPAPPTLTSPANGAILPVGEDITFEWNNSSGAVRSRVKICTDLEMNNPISSAPFETGTTSTIVSSSFFVAGVTYHWQASSIGSDESAGWGIYGPTPPWSFTVTLPVADSPVFVPLYRLYKNSIHDHYYTTIPAHRDDYVQNKGYTYEKIECYISDRPFDHPDCGALFHLWDINNDIHFYTSDESEKAIKMGQGFSDQGPVGYIYTAPADGMVPFYYVEHQANTDHFYTISKFEFDNATDNYGFVDKGVVGYVSPCDLKDRDAHTRPQANYGGVDLGSGAYRGLNNRDLVLRGRGPSLAFSHYYNSFNFSRYPMGQGWSHGFYSHIFEEIEDDKVYVFWGNGTVSEFTKTGSNPSDYHDETGDHDALAIVDDGVNYGYDLKKKDQTVYKFRVIGGDYFRDIVLISVEDWTGKRLLFNYEAANATLLSVRDESGRKLQLSYYYPSRQLQKVEEVIDDVVERSVLFAYNDKELLVSFTDSREKVTSYAYYEEDGPRKNLLKSITYPEHNTVELNYDDDKRVNWIKIGNDLPSTITYTSPNTAVVRDPRGHTFTSIHNGFRLTSLQGQIDPDPETFVYGDVLNPNKPTHFADKEGNTTDFEYDSMGNIKKIKNARGKVALFTYNTDVGKNNIKSSTEFYTEGTAITQTVYNYDTDGNRLRSITNPENETMWLYYDTNHQVTSIKDGRSKYTHFAYDAYGNLERVTDAKNNVTSYVNDYAGRTIQVIDGENKNTWYSYDNTDNLTLVKNHLNHDVVLSYNDNSLLKAVTWLNNGVTSSTNYGYDSEDRLESVTNPLTRVTSFTYNESGNLETRNDYNGVTTTYQYDENSRLKTINYPGDVDDISIGRDKNGSIISATCPEGESKFEYNELNLLKKYTDPNGNIVQYEYNDAGRPKTLTYPGGKTVTYWYDKAGRLQSVQDWITGSNPTTYEYDDAGNLTKIVRPNNTEAIYTYDDASRLSGITEQKIGGAAICSYAYTLDGVGNHNFVTATEQLTGSVLPKDVSYTHDKANRLLSADSVAYTYDNNGNRMTSTDAGGTSYTWNHENMLTGIVENSPSGSVQYKYDGMNNRIVRIEGSNTTRYVLDLSGDMSRVLAETDENGTIQAYYVYGLGLISRITPDESRYFYHYNNSGDTIALTDASGSVTDSYTYDEYGKLLDSTGSTWNPFKFVGRYGVMDEGDDLYFMRARFYDAEVGRFLSEDPLGFGGGDWNLYAYVGGNPVIGIDPEGLEEVGTANSTLPLIGIDMGLELNNISPEKTVITAQKDPWKKVCSNGICYRIKHKNLDDITFWDLVKIPFWRWKQIVSPFYGDVLDEVLPPYGTHPYYEIDEDSYEPDPLWNCNNCGYPS